jgi:2-octaprenyl-6-methoxyphenol hydroxylase
VAGQTRTITTQLVVAADGARSQLRQTAGIRQTGWKYWQSCVTFKVKARQSHQSHQNIAYEKFRTQGPFAILPLTGDRCNVVWTLPHAEAQAMMALDEAAFNRAMREHFGDHMGDLDIISPRRLFPVQLMQSQRYVTPRFALAGDAAHCCHPVGGQGVNLGIRDAAALAEVLGDAFRAGEDLGSVAVLQRYERWRRWENWVVLGFTDSLDRLFSNEIGPLVWVRQLGFWGLTTIAPIRRLALQLMTGGLGRQPKISISR